MLSQPPRNRSCWGSAIIAWVLQHKSTTPTAVSLEKNPGAGPWRYRFSIDNFLPSLADEYDTFAAVEPCRVHDEASNVLLGAGQLGDQLYSE